MRILRPIVEAATDLVPIGVAQLSHRCGIRAKPVDRDTARLAALLQDPLEKLQRRSLVSLRSDHRLQNLAFMVDGAPERAVHFLKPPALPGDTYCYLSCPRSGPSADAIAYELDPGGLERLTNRLSVMEHRNRTGCLEVADS